MSIIIGIAFALAVSAGIICWEAFVLTKLWAWFLAPAFGLPEIGLALSFGICAIASMLTNQYTQRDEDKNSDALMFGIAHPAICLLIGWVAK